LAGGEKNKTKKFMQGRVTEKTNSRKEELSEGKKNPAERIALSGSQTVHA